MAECREQNCVEFQCSKLGRCGRRLEVEKRSLLGATSCGAFEYFSSRIQIMTEHESDFSSQVDFKIASARDHWTEVRPAVLQISDVATLRERWRSRSLCFVEKGISLGRKIGEGGQAEIFEAFFQKRNVNLIAKVFKEVDSLESLLDQCPSQIFRFEGDCKYIIRIIAGVILDCVEDSSLHGRFAFLMFRYEDDLRSVIDKYMKRNGNREPPFEASKAFRYMIEIACGMKILHSKQTLHRDLKASNILVWSRTDETGSSDGEEFYCAVADYECSIGVLGTTFWRAPEVLQALQDRQHKPQFTTKVDVYSYAMTCYEILTGSVPFEDHCKSDYSLVISGVRPELPSDVNVHMRELLSRCWHAIPDERPEFSEIVETVGSIMTMELNVPEDTVETLKKPRPDYLYS